MYPEITLSDLFMNAKDVYDLLSTLEKHKEERVKFIYSYGFQAIEIQKLINHINIIKKETFDLEEIHRAINFIMHS